MTANGDASMLSSSGARHRIGREVGLGRFETACLTGWLYADRQDGIRCRRDCKLCFRAAPVDGAE